MHTGGMNVVLHAIQIYREYNAWCRNKNKQEAEYSVIATVKVHVKKKCKVCNEVVLYFASVEIGKCHWKNAEFPWSSEEVKTLVCFLVYSINVVGGPGLTGYICTGA